MRYFSTFTGIGGFELGIIKAYENTNRRKLSGKTTKSVRSGRTDSARLRVGRKQNAVCIGYSEIDRYATQIYSKQFPKHKNYGDITKINEKELPDFDLFVGGFPCQAFSIAGKRGGFEDTRGTLFFDIARILKAKRPRHVLLENVKGLLSHDEGRTFKTIIATFTELGYGVEWQVLNTKNFGIPQNRERVYIVGHSGGFRGRAVFPFGTGGKKDIKPDGRKSTEVFPTIRATHYKSGDNQPVVAQPFIQNPKMRNYKKDYNNSVAITASVYKEPPTVNAIRRLTPTECERLQGFPDGWTNGVSDTQRYKTLGNAVTTNVVEAIISRLI